MEIENGRKMATKMEKWTRKWDFGLILAIFPFGGQFLATSGPRPFSIFFPTSLGCLLRASFPSCKRPLQMYCRRVLNGTHFKRRARRKKLEKKQRMGPRSRDEPKGTNASLWFSARSCAFLRFPAKIFGFLRQSTVSQMLCFLGEGENLQKYQRRSAKICVRAQFVRFVPLSAP